MINVAKHSTVSQFQVNSVLLKDVTVAYGRNVVLKQLDLEIGPNTRVAILGRNAAGKSTLFKTMLGLLNPVSGQSQIAGFPSDSLPRTLREQIGYLPDVPLPYRWMSAREHIQFVSSFYSEWDSKRCEDLLSRFSISKNSRLRSLSRGTLDKLLFTTTICGRPKLLICDEPFTNVDLIARTEILNILADYSRESEATIVLATHRMDDIEALADEVAVLSMGRIHSRCSLEVLRESNWHHVILSSGQFANPPTNSTSLNIENTEWLVPGDSVPVLVGERLTGGCTVKSITLLGRVSLATFFRLATQSSVS